MTYFPDLSRYAYSRCEGRSTTSLSVGWLSRDHACPRSVPRPEVLDLLWEHCRFIVFPTLGLHTCELCVGVPYVPHSFVRGETRLLLGSGEIRVFGGSGEVFAAPNLVYHYVADHHYAPPPAFVEALENGPRPGSDEHLRLLETIAPPHHDRIADREVTWPQWHRNNPIASEPQRIRFGRPKTVWNGKSNGSTDRG